MPFGLVLNRNSELLFWHTASGIDTGAMPWRMCGHMPSNGYIHSPRIRIWCCRTTNNALYLSHGIELDPWYSDDIWRE